MVEIRCSSTRIEDEDGNGDVEKEARNAGYLRSDSSSGTR